MGGGRAMNSHRIISSLFLLVLTVLPIRATALVDSLQCGFRLGYNVGGTAPVGMPATIRSMNSYVLTPSFCIGADVSRQFNRRWGLVVGVHLENKGMNIDATVKNYHIEIVRGGQRLEGMFTGNNKTKVEQWMFTLPVMLSYTVAQDLSLRFGPYASYVVSRDFSGYAYDGRLRVGNPTGPMVELGGDSKTRGSYDFSGSLRRMQYGVLMGADWRFGRRWGTFIDLSWGLTGIFHSSFDTIEQTLYPIYGTIGLTYRMK